MEKLTKKYKIIANEGKLIFPLTAEGVPGEVYPGNGTVYAEFDTFEEADAYVRESGLVYEEPQEEVTVLD